MKKAMKVATSILVGYLSFSPQLHANYSEHPEADPFINTMVENHKFDRQDIVRWLANAEKKESIIKAMSRPAEKVKPWHEYRKHFISEQRINGGAAFWRKHQATLEQAYRDYGVDPAIIVSIIGVETNYGKNTGSYKVIDALTTLAFDYYTYHDKRESRKKFFTSELENFLLLAREQNRDPLSLKGSYAGAMGLGQFMPSSYRNYAVDYDNDQFADIWSNPTDAIASVANYFAKHGWRNGEAVATRAHISPSPDESSINKLHRPKESLSQLADKGYTPVSELPADSVALPMKFKGKYGPEYWLGLHNFYVISRYNPRTKYAMAVYQLSELIRERNHELAKRH